MTWAQTERAALCDLLLSVGPDAPTLCAGWDAHDLAVHLWIRETDPLGAPGIVAKPLSGLLDRRMAETRQRWPYEELVGRVRRGPARFSVFALPGVDEGANSTEFFVHHEDLRRAGPAPQPPRTLDAEVEDWLWRRLKLLARAWFRRVPVGVLLERAATDGRPPAAEPDTIRAAAGSSTVTLVGRPGELLLYAHGRGAVAEVAVVGEPDAVAAVQSADYRL